MTEAWGDELTVAVDYAPESEDYEGGFEAVTMMGIPRNVFRIGSDPGSAEDWIFTTRTSSGSRVPSSCSTAPSGPL